MFNMHDVNLFAYSDVFQFLSSNTSEVLDRFHIVKPEAK